MRNLAALSSGLAVAFVLVSSVVNGQAPIRPARTAASVLLPSARGQNANESRRTSELVCDLSAFFSIDAADRMKPTTKLDGRGLMSCQNEQGFTSEVPILADLEVELPKDAAPEGEVSLSGKSSTFVIPRDIAQLQDTYTPHQITRGPASVADDSQVLLRGRHHDLVIEMALTSQAQAAQKIHVKSMHLRFDDAAPDLF